MASSENPEPKIVVDDDWKSRVQKEKEELQHEPGAKAKQRAAELPPASLEMLVTSLAMQAMSSMGMLPDPLTGKATVHRDSAKQLIDLISVLQSKTAGNATEYEAEMFTQTLHQLRLLFVTPGWQNADSDEVGSKPSSIELP